MCGERGEEEEEGGEMGWSEERGDGGRRDGVGVKMRGRRDGVGVNMRGRRDRGRGRNEGMEREGEKLK